MRIKYGIPTANYVDNLLRFECSYVKLLLYEVYVEVQRPSELLLVTWSRILGMHWSWASVRRSGRTLRFLLRCCSTWNTALSQSLMPHFDSWLRPRDVIALDALWRHVIFSRAKWTSQHYVTSSLVPLWRHVISTREMNRIYCPVTSSLKALWRHIIPALQMNDIIARKSAPSFPPYSKHGPSWWALNIVSNYSVCLSQ